MQIRMRGDHHQSPDSLFQFHMDTRITKLLGLLASNSTVISEQTAQSLAESVQNVADFLNQLEPYLLDKNWSTRVAAAKVLKCLSGRPQIIENQNNLQSDDFIVVGLPHLLHQSVAFNLEEQLKLEALLASSGDEYQKTTTEPLESKLTMWSTIDKQVGMDAKLLGLSSREWLTDEDVKTEENFDRSSPASIGESTSKRIKLEEDRVDFKPVEDVSEREANIRQFMEKWVYGKFMLKLQTNRLLFSPLWYERHGCLLGLMELVKMLLKLAKTDINQSSLDQVLMVVINSLLRLAVRDRFSDFVGSQIVVPVRETIAQIIGVISVSASKEVLNELISYLHQFIHMREAPWECVHFALLSFKYIIGAVGMNSEDTSGPGPQVVREFLPFITRCLSSPNEDVLSAACACLLIVSDQMLSEEFTEETLAVVQHGITAVTKCSIKKKIEDSRDSASPSSDAIETSLPSILELLGKLIKSENCIHLEFFVNWTFLRGIFSFFDHPLDTVRLSAAQFLVSIFDLAHAGTLNWTQYLFTTSDFELRIASLLQLVYRRFFTEGNDQIVGRLTVVWKRLIDGACDVDQRLFVRSVCKLVGMWLSFLMVPDGSPKLDPSHLKMFDSDQFFNSDWDLASPQCIIGGEDFIALPSESQQRLDLVTKTKMRVSKDALAPVFDKISLLLDIGNHLEPPCISLYRLFDFHLNSTSILQRSAVAMVIRDWASDYPNSFSEWIKLVRGSQADFNLQKVTVAESLWLALSAPPTLYDELKYKMTEIDSVCRNYLTSLVKEGITSVRSLLSELTVFAADQAIEITSSTSKLIEPRLITPAIVEKRLCAHKNLLELNAHMETMTRRLGLWLAAAILETQYLPAKFNPLIKPLMDVVKFENSTTLIAVAGRALAIFLTLAHSREPSPNEKILKNLCSFLAQDVLGQIRDNSDSEIWSLTKLLDESRNKTVHLTDNYCRNSGFGAEKTLGEIVGYHQEHLVIYAKVLWNGLDLSKTFSAEDTIRAQLTAMKLWTSVFSLLPQKLQDEVFFDRSATLACNNQGVLLDCLTSNLVTIRHWVCRSVATCCSVNSVKTINCIFGPLIRSFNKDEENLVGNIELIYVVVETLAHRIVGLISLLTAPVMKCMAHSVPSIRQLASVTFGMLVTLMPLEKSFPTELADDLKLVWNENYQFLSALMHPSVLHMSQLPFALNGVSLRSYQLEGISWISFLAQYGLHGILCDDMGLGKTLQTLCAIASSYASSNSHSLPPSLIIAPNTVVTHWVNEVERFFAETEVLKPFALIGSKMSRNQLQEVLSGISSYNIIVMSYECARKEIRLIQEGRWHYCVLDEGHLIKNHKSQLFKALVTIPSSHRLILTGTPIQNSVIELWSLFEFLMPGFLGTFSHFNAKFAKPIAASREAKTSSKDAENGQKALELLHKQVLPFIMRRQKEQVLKDLPPKIVQDYYCDLSWIQARLYEDFSRQSKMLTDQSGLKQNVFQMLLYLRKLCDHPSLIFNPSHPRFDELEQEMRSQGSTILDLQSSGKMLALAEILSECGIGCQNSRLPPFDATHRALIFCQFKGMIDLVAHYIDSGELSCLIQTFEAEELSQSQSTPITYLRLDGSVPAHQRQSIADRFNQDPDVDLLLLSTQVGGLGLNLTGADIVIFIDHDWNPTRDLQAMDRAHRLGQNSTVNVYRLITRGTLEEKIMRLQMFKTRVANTVIDESNRSLMTMATDQIVDLLTLESTFATHTTKGKGEAIDIARNADITPNESQGISLDELWNTPEYDEAFNMDKFLQSVSHTS